MFTSEEEETISGELYRHIDALLDADPPEENWMEFYHARNEDPQNEPSPLDGKLPKRRGKSRRRIDLRLVLHLPPRISFRFEAKRLYKGDSADKYIGPSGLGRFLTGVYARSDARVGMLGYVQKGTVAEWYDKVEEKICALPSIISLPSGEKCQRVGIAVGLNDSFISEHNRLTIDGSSLPNVQVFHSFLVFT